MGHLVRWVERRYVFSRVEARAGGFDLKDLALLHPDEYIAVADRIGGIGPVNRGAARVFPFLVDIFLGEQLECALARVVDLERTDGSARLDHCVGEVWFIVSPLSSQSKRS